MTACSSSSWTTCCWFVTSLSVEGRAVRAAVVKSGSESVKLPSLCAVAAWVRCFRSTLLLIFLRLIGGSGSSGAGSSGSRALMKGQTSFSAGWQCDVTSTSAPCINALVRVCEYVLSLLACATSCFVRSEVGSRLVRERSSTCHSALFRAKTPKPPRHASRNGSKRSFRARRLLI